MTFIPGEPVVYRVAKMGTHPGPRAQRVQPASAGEDYRYEVDKFWTVAAILEDGRLLLRTRRGKEHVVESHDPRLRRPRWWERWLYSYKFPPSS